MHKIGLFLDNSNEIKFNCDTLLNPGIGGTEYLFILLSILLTKYFDVTLFCKKNLILENFDSENINIVYVDDFSKVISLSTTKSIEVLIVRDLEFVDYDMNQLNDINLKIIAWTHNYQSYKLMNTLYSCASVKRNVCVSREQYELLRGHKIFLKSDFVFNMIPVHSYRPNYNKIENSVCFVGNLDKNKGFDLVAKNWPSVLKKYPEAQLYVIGNGKLYDKNEKLGKYKLAEENYENLFMKYLIDSHGNILNSVHFVGLLGNDEKVNLMSQMTIGVTNPTGWHETFCISAVEFEALEIPVVSIKGYGYLDTVKNNETGILFNKHKKNFSNEIVYILNNNDVCKKMGLQGRKFVKETFDITVSIKKWVKVINDVINEIECIPDYKIKNPICLKKFNLNVYRKAKKVIPFLPYPYNTGIKTKVINIFKNKKREGVKMNSKIGIISIVDYNNYGNRLQNYAVVNLLRNYHYDVVNDLIIYNKNYWIKQNDSFFKKILKTIYPFKLWKANCYNPHKLNESNNDLRKNNFLNFNKYSDICYIVYGTNKNISIKLCDEDYKFYVVGSDQIWNPYNFNFYSGMLSFTSSSKKIALSPSIGITSLTDDQRQEFKERLSDFKCLSCREEQGSKMIREITGRECTTLIDPTLMLSSNEWDKVSKKPDFHNENDKYILLYFLGELTKEYKDIISNISKKYNLKVIDIYDKNSKYYSCGPSEFIYMIKHCSIMLTDSFHGSVFSYIYNKPFRIFKRIDSMQSMNSRLENLINVLHLSNDIYINIDNFDLEHVLDDPNYDKDVLVSEQKKFKDYLDKAFE